MTLACIAAAWLFGATPANACSCSGFAPACEGVWRADAVFVGRVVNIASLENGRGKDHAFLRSRRVTLEVLESFRGERLRGASGGAPTVDVFTGQGGGDCGIGFKEGERYLVFANVSKTGPAVLQTGLCDRTRELSHAEEELPYLRSLATSTARGGRVYGYVELIETQVGERRLGAAPPERKRLADMRITLTAEDGAGATKTTSTNASGRYEFTNLAPGTYRVEASLPDIYHYAGGGRTPFIGELRDPRGCSEVNLYVVPDRPISGR